MNDTPIKEDDVVEDVEATKMKAMEFWDQIDEGDTISIIGLSGLAPNTPVACVLHKADGASVEINANHTLSPEQIEWFHAGSALNLIRQQTMGS